MRRTAAWTVALILVLVACGGGEEGGDTAEPPLTQRPEPTPVTAPPDGSDDPPPTIAEGDDLDPEAREIVEAAMSDLATRAGSDTDEIELVSFEYVTWNDGSLGCPRPGEMYTQALVDGSRTVLELDGATYDYHAGNDGQPFLCENPAPGSGTVPSRER